MLNLLAGTYKTKAKLLWGSGWPKLDFNEMSVNFVNHISQYLYDRDLQKSNACNYEMTQNPSFM